MTLLRIKMLWFNIESHRSDKLNIIILVLWCTYSAVVYIECCHGHIALWYASICSIVVYVRDMGSFKSIETAKPDRLIYTEDIWVEIKR